MKNVQRRATSIARPLVVLLALCLAIVLSACSTPDRPAQEASSIEMVDDAGRTVELSGPLTNVVVANRYNVELIRAMGSIDAVTSVDTNTAQDRAYWPQFDPENVIGKGQSELNLEKIVDLRPQALILPRNGPVDEYAAKLEPAGIKVLTVTGWDNAELPKQMDILGKAFGNEDGAQKVTDMFTSVSQQITDAVGDQPRKSVYWEYGDPFTTAIPGTSNDGWHQMVVMAGGTNIFADADPAGANVDPEAVLAADPDLIVKTTSGGALKNTGVYTPPAAGAFDEVGAEMTSRPGWNGLDAVRNGHVHFLTGFAGGGLGKVVGSAYVAKWLYPEQTADLDPDQVFADWMKLQNMPPVDGHVHTLPAQR